MSISEEMAQLTTERLERIAANTVFGDLQRARNTMLELNNNIQQVVAEYGNFNTLPNTTKQAYAAAWKVIKDAIVAFEDPIIVKLLDWRP